MADDVHGEAGERTEESNIDMPAPSFWPMVLAFGITLLLGGLLTHWSVSVVGLIIASRAVFGWWGDVIPVEEHHAMPVNEIRRPYPIKPEERSVVRLKPGEARHRMAVPEKIHPISSGVWGGLVGGGVMAALACLYGLIAQGSIWYPVNLLAGAVVPSMGDATVAQLRAFHPLYLIAASGGHIGLSILVGIVYAAILPMFPKFAPLWGGILMPLVWSALTATALGILNPALNERISWPWFVACQLGYGIVGGFVIARSTSIDTMQGWDFASRAFVDAPGLRPPDKDRAE